MSTPGNLLIKGDRETSTANLRITLLLETTFWVEVLFFSLNISVDIFPDGSYDAYRLFANGFHHSQMVIGKST